MRLFGQSLKECFTNFALKLSEKSRRSQKRGLVKPFRATARPISASEQRPNSCSEPYSSPFSDSFEANFSEVRGFVGDAKPLVLLGIYTPLTREYAAFVARPTNAT
jgi:hypothetical protein